MTDPIPFRRLPHPAPTPPARRAEILAAPGFGVHFSDHMVTIDWDAERDWHNATLGPRAPIMLDPAAAVLHYAQEIFEGMKAYAAPGENGTEGGITLFRADANAARFNASARRLAMPEMPEALFLAGLRELVLADRAWLPAGEGEALYLRPFMIATEAFLGVRAAHAYKFVIIASPAGNYFKSGAAAVSIWISDYSRAAPGGTGAAKCGGNYAASLVPTAEAHRLGYDQVLFLDATERRWVEELGGMNLFFAFADGRLLTPPLSGTILPGITRDSLITLARDQGLEVLEDHYSLDAWREDAVSGRLVECFACGTAAVVTSVGSVTGRDGGFTIGSGGPGQIAAQLKARLVGIQRGTATDPYGWVTRLA